MSRMMARFASCANKRRHARQADALASAAHRAGRGVKGLRVYRCKYCKGWHLTSRLFRNE